jgi:hypothetical protein
VRIGSIKIDKLVLACTFPVTIIFVSLILLAASDLRGSDQYWYVADVETLLKGGNTTNEIYSAQIMSAEAHIPCPFMHNVLNLYLVLPAVKIFGVFKGWIVTNLLASVLTASLIALLVATVANKWAAVLAYTVYLLLPLTVWQSAQPLAEATIAPFVALGVLIYVLAGTNKKLWGLMVILACAAYYCRASFLPILFVIPVAYLFQSRPVGIKNILSALGFLGVVIFAVIIGKIIFVQGMPTSFHKMINNAIPGVTRNMHFLFSLSPRPIVLREIWLKATAHLSYQLFPHSWKLQIFYFPFNLLAILSVYLYFTKKSKMEVRVAHCAIALLLLHIATIIIHQNQFRYLLVITPAVLAGSVMVLSKVKLFQSRRMLLILILGAVVFLTTSNIALVTKLRQDGFSEERLRTALHSMLDDVIPEDESLIVDASYRYNQVLSYVLRPRIVILVESGYKYEEYQTIRERGKAKWLLCPLESPLVEHFNISSSPTLKNFPHPYENYALFHL